MKISNLTDNEELGKEGGNFVLNMGVLPRGVNNTKKIRISDVESTKVSFRITCGCTKITNKTIVDDSILEVDISVVTSGVYVKIAEIIVGASKTLLKLKGEFK